MFRLEKLCHVACCVWDIKFNKNLGLSIYLSKPESSLSQLSAALFMPKKPQLPIHITAPHPESGHRGVSTDKVGREYLLATEYSDRPMERVTARAIKDCTPTVANGTAPKRDAQHDKVLTGQQLTWMRPHS